MISSTRDDLEQYRKEASKAVKNVAGEREKRVQLIEISMEKNTQSGGREFAVAVSKRWVEESDWVVAIVGWNYGTISDEPGADGLSVTEWEFRHASKLGKKLFVFIAGSPDSANRYRVSDEEKEDLKDWIPRQTKEQKEKLEEFRRNLGKRHAEMFTNLQAFRERLKMTLKYAIDDLPPEIQSGTPLAELIVSVTPDIRDCIRRVTLVANCKTIHDRLHELRQHVIRPLREEVLPVWKQEGYLSDTRERVILGCVFKMSRQLGVISEARKPIGSEHKGLLTSVDEVLQWSELWNVELDSPDSNPGRDVFAERVDKFANDVQEAFSEADRSMTREESDLRERYFALLEGLKQARQQQNLSPSEQQRLDDELEKVDANRSRVKNSLTLHHSWQEAHDKLEEVESFREYEYFERKLNYYRVTPLTKLHNLVEQELGLTEAHRSGGAETEQTAVASGVGQEPPLASHLHTAHDAFVDDLRYLKTCLEALQREAGVSAFDNMRKYFDDAFYFVDKRALNEVEKARERVAKLEEWLDGLSKARKETI